MFEVIDAGIARSKAPVNGTVKAGSRVFTTHVPKDPTTGEIVEGSMDVQARRLFDNLTMALAAAGGSLKDVVSVLIFLTDASEFEAMNAVYREYFAEPYPTRATVVVKELIGGKARIELQAQAWIE
ncbi:RidA family protein [Methylobacterium sp. ID0610]|uniref:RidA family protein n=1 Tax=Methylobacterium carpenticola TaxID=3344827 RepID=UPI0036D07325